MDFFHNFEKPNVAVNVHLLFLWGALSSWNLRLGASPYNFLKLLCHVLWVRERAKSWEGSVCPIWDPIPSIHASSPQCLEGWLMGFPPWPWIHHCVWGHRGCSSFTDIGDPVPSLPGPLPPRWGVRQIEEREKQRSWAGEAARWGMWEAKLGRLPGGKKKDFHADFVFNEL